MNKQFGLFSFGGIEELIGVDCFYADYCGVGSIGFIVVGVVIWSVVAAFLIFHVW